MPLVESVLDDLIKRDELLAEIAKKKLRIPTLATQHSDRLDFHDIGVWNIKAALEAAYEAGRQKGIEEGREAGKEQLVKSFQENLPGEEGGPCPHCGETLTFKDIDGGRCLSCNTMLT